MHLATQCVWQPPTGGACRSFKGVRIHRRTSSIPIEQGNKSRHSISCWACAYEKREDKQAVGKQTETPGYQSLSKSRVLLGPPLVGVGIKSASSNPTTIYV